MVPVVVDHQFVIHQSGDTTCVLPVDTHTDVRLLHVIKAVVDDDIGPTLQSVFHEIFQLGEFLFCNLCHDLAQVQSALTEIRVKIVRLIVSPVEFLILHPIFPKDYGVHLRDGGLHGQEGERGDGDYFSYDSQVQHT